MRVVFVAALGGLLIAGPASAQGMLDFDRPGPGEAREMYYASVRTEVNELLIRWKNAWDRDDANALSKFYAADARYLPAGLPAVQTRDAIREHFAQLMGAALDAQVRLADFGTSGDLAYVTVGISYQAEKQAVRRTDLLVLRRRSNQWQIEMHFARVEE
jgi:ketosteroid isomerase-like protein